MSYQEDPFSFFLSRKSFWVFSQYAEEVVSIHYGGSIFSIEIVPFSFFNWISSSIVLIYLFV